MVATALVDAPTVKQRKSKCTDQKERLIGLVNIRATL